MTEDFNTAEDLKYWIWLSTLPGIGSKRSEQLIDLFGSPRNLWHAKRKELEKVHFLSREMIEQIVSYPLKVLAQKHMETIHKYNIKVIRIIDESYPVLLKNIYDPPMVIYVRGTLSPDEKAIAFVGSRNATDYGNTVARQLAWEVARRGITVVSGLARGIDSYAHEGALKAGGRTIAVLGCGPDIAYPPCNRELMERIINSGAVVSEYAPGTPPLRGNFPARNRIISGLSMGVTVVEAGEKSGALITAEFALEQGREVFAVPGNVNSHYSKGTNRLIKEGAKIVTDVNDIIEELVGVGSMNEETCPEEETSLKDKISFKDEASGRKEISPRKGICDNNVYPIFTEEEVKIINCLSKCPLHIDIISEKSGLSIRNVSSNLSMLEMKGLIEQLPGKMFRLRK